MFWCLCVSVSIRHLDMLPNYRGTRWTLGKSLGSALSTLAKCQSIEMYYSGWRSRIYWSMGHAKWSYSYEGEDEGCRYVRNIPRGEGHQIVSWVCQIVSPLCSQIYIIGNTPNVPHVERCTMDMGSLTAKSSLATKGSLCNMPLLVYPGPSKPYVVVTDALGQSVGSNLMQGKGLVLRPIAFISRVLKPIG